MLPGGETPSRTCRATRTDVSTCLLPIMTRFASVPSFLFGVLAVLLCSAGAVHAQTTDTVVTDGDLPFTVGEPVADSSTALILTYGDATRTVGAEAYDRALQSVTQGRPIPPGQETAVHRQAVLGQAIRMTTSHANEIQRIDVDTAAVGEQYRQQQARFADSTAFADALSQAGLSPDSLRSMIAASLRMNAYRDSVSQTLDAPPADSVSSYAQDQGTVGARHILLQIEPGATSAVEDSLESLAASLIDSVQAGADFARLAETYSDGPTGARGGDLGTFTRDRMVEPFADAAFSMEDSSDVYPEPVRTEYGFHVIQLTEAPAPLETEEAKAALMEERVQEAFRNEIERLMKNVTVRMNPEIIPITEADLRR